MKIKLSQSDLAKGLQFCLRLVKNNPQLPILSHVLVSLEGKSLHLRATDLNAGVNLVMPVESIENPENKQKIAISAQALFDYLQTLKAQPIDLAIDGRIIKITQDKNQASFPLSEAEEYPDFTIAPLNKTEILEIGDCDTSLRQLMIAVALDDSRPTLTGIYFEADEKDKELANKSINLVTTDGYRLSRVVVPAVSQWKHKIVVPAKIFTELVKGTADKSLKFAYDEANKQARIDADSKQIAIRVLQGEFPQYYKIIPSGYQTKVVGDQEGLLLAIKQMAVFARTNANIVKWQIRSKNLVMTTQKSLIGEGRSEVEVGVEGDDLAIGFNFRYLQEYLQACQTGEIEMWFNGPLSPVKFLNHRQPGFTHIIMPVKLDGE